eukprot:TRINITY_DN35529_c0_g1_i1.p1 TRINITY_DN35529_c0_g1~~TRINITY_DN35529_c0_g1_i1.p1  ORF type:complete len:305 (-),score=33.73 TRINITY_DN35529_c0_g1_i1:566-1399(-)
MCIRDSLNTIMTPTINGTYMLDITTYSTDKTTILDSYQDFLIISPNTLTVSGALICGEPSQTNNKKYSILEIQFTAPQDYQTGSLIYISFDDGGWDTDLGTGLSDLSEIPCKSISNLAGTIVCILYHGSTQKSPLIIIKNFNEIISGTSCQIGFPQITNPNQAAANSDIKIQISVVRLENRIPVFLNSETLTIPFATYNFVNQVSSAISVVPSSSDIESTFTLTISPSFTQDLSAGDKIIIQLPTYDTGFSDGTSLTCNILHPLISSHSCFFYESIG